MDNDTTLVETSPTPKIEKCPMKSSFKSPFRSGITKLQNRGEVSLKTCNTTYTRLLNEKQLSLQNRVIYNDLTRKISFYRKEITNLSEAINIMKKYDKELKLDELIMKWRNVCQSSMSYLFNATLFKIDKLGGYEEFIRKEIEAEKAKLEYQLDDSVEEEISGILESDEFQALPPDDQEEYKIKFEEKREEVEKVKQNALKVLDDKLILAQNKEITMEELTKRLKVDYNLVYPSSSL
ncbi:similar to Saccharomyces cerevisiae YPL121C MEI5 Meiosis specific protein involved in DMC1-dependent meiotic recombination, forms heterodimer with Sae3p [Maudiozyma saulgeensis]|uniref:Similar to Saccharomyces cerevisiae YPL121C MEI5 Meiosis specific protein involved in DMC1-dependent meiotic recombination, forms heterodimer with Sae3p n=1 Tax=Maudiozyma saulgeensis TaxID=1789683 RepID=A0A1X7R926_9SACH|nr:similar to Saccharomyces cerevisiae YPL121C MEI5 Meiosis specific protein involved in DMC1-dependent meiotic recombination, forms heterodimer with Sae3p [Kazachstania saulgeensis]